MPFYFLHFIHSPFLYFFFQLLQRGDWLHIHLQRLAVPSFQMIIRIATLSHSRILQLTPEQQASRRLLLQYFSLFLLLRSLTGRLREGEANLIWLLTTPNGISGRARAESWIDDCRKKRHCLCDSGAYFRVFLSVQKRKPPVSFERKGSE